MCKKMGDDKGYTLVELVAVMAIMVVMVGVLALSMTLVFNQDAQRAAKIINSELQEARMLAMSKAGDIEMTIHTTASDPEGYKIDITGGAVNRSVSLDGSISVSLTCGGVAVPGAAAYKDITVKFDKADGKLEKIQGATPVTIDTTKTYEIVIVAQRGTGHTQKVIIAPNTGRHYVEE